MRFGISVAGDRYLGLVNCGSDHFLLLEQLLGSKWGRITILCIKGMATSWTEEAEIYQHFISGSREYSD